MIKENGITAIASLAESAKTKFIPYYEGTIKQIAIYMNNFNEPVYRQFKGQVIEALTIISSAVGLEAFLPHAPALVQILVDIHKRVNDPKDPQSTYLLSAW
jgi:hypothetical protein